MLVSGLVCTGISVSQQRSSRFYAAAVHSYIAGANNVGGLTIVLLTGGLTEHYLPTVLCSLSRRHASQSAATERLGRNRQ
jgi:hypothetical protein